MRIISGVKKGKRLHSVSNSFIRPSSDKVKESVFNVLSNLIFIEDKYIMDLFCGIGSLGLEALSRGAKEVTFVDINKKAIKLTGKNVKACGFEDRANIVKQDVYQWLKLETNKNYHIAFADPPYEKFHVNYILNSLYLKNRLSYNGVLVLEHSKQEITDVTPNWKILKSKSYGDTKITILSPNEE